VLCQGDGEAIGEWAVVDAAVEAALEDRTPRTEAAAQLAMLAGFAVAVRRKTMPGAGSEPGDMAGLQARFRADFVRLRMTAGMLQHLIECGRAGTTMPQSRRLRQMLAMHFTRRAEQSCMCCCCLLCQPLQTRRQPAQHASMHFTRLRELFHGKVQKQDIACF
jgi:hypothetical protein